MDTQVNKRETYLPTFAAFGAGLLIAIPGFLALYLIEYFPAATTTTIMVFAAWILISVWINANKQSIWISWEGDSQKRLDQLIFFVQNVTGATSKLLFILAITKIGVSSAVFYLYFASYSTTFIISHTFLKQKVTVAIVVSLASAIVGLRLFTEPVDTSLVAATGIILSLLTGISDGIYVATLKNKFISNNIHRRVMLFWNYLFASIALFTVSRLLGDTVSLPQVDLMSALKIVVCILFAGMVYWGFGELVIYSFSRIPINNAIIILSTELIWTMVFAALLFAILPTPFQIIGAAFLLFAIFLREVDERTKEAQAQQEEKSKRKRKDLETA